MHIAIVNHEYPPVGGGAATASYQTARALCSMGHQVTVITAAVANRPAREIHDGVVVERIFALRTATFAPSSVELLSFCAACQLGLRRRLKRLGVEGVIAYFAVPAGYFAVKAARSLGVPAVLSLRGSDVPGFKLGRLEGIFGTLAKPLVRHTLHQAGIVAPNSEVLRRLTLAFAPEIRTKIRVIANGIEVPVIDRAASSNTGELHIIQVGQLIPRKRVDVTLAAIDLLAARGVRAKATLVGDGPLRAQLAALAQTRGIGDRVRFLGRRPRAEILALLRCHDVFVMTSAAEGMSNALLEAMASGLPIVTTDNGSDDLVTRADCGVVIGQGDAHALADQLQRFSAAPELRNRFAKNGLKSARQMTWPACARGFIEALADAAAQR